jgi:hypothetical protein
MSFVKQLAATVGLCFLVALPSCSPKIVERVKVVTEYRNVYQVDTTIQHDSVYIREWVKGDTVRIVEYRDKYVYRYKTIRDTLIKRDSVAVETLKEVKVEKPLSWSQSVKLGAFPWLLLITGVLGVWTFRKPLRGCFTKLWKLIFK